MSLTVCENQYRFKARKMRQLSCRQSSFTYQEIRQSSKQINKGQAGNPESKTGRQGQKSGNQAEQEKKVLSLAGTQKTTWWQVGGNGLGYILKDKWENEPQVWIWVEKTRCR